jgi:membrane protease YdiL (CAAX protease family)
MLLDKSSTRKRRALIEVSVGYALILLAVWTPRPLQTWIEWVAFVWVLGVTLISFDGWRNMGLGPIGLLRSLWVVGVALAISMTAAVCAHIFHSLHAPRTLLLFVHRFWGYAIWAFLQQFLLLDFILLRLLCMVRRELIAVIGATGLFAVAHLPNPILTVATLLFGFAACLLFLRYRNIYTLAIAHALLGICIAVTVPGSVSHNMRVGLGYFTYRPPHHHQRSEIDQAVSTVACNS